VLVYIDQIVSPALSRSFTNNMWEKGSGDCGITMWGSKTNHDTSRRISIIMTMRETIHAVG